MSRAGGVDYLIFGTLYPYRLERCGTSLSRRSTNCPQRAVSAAGVPVLAIGGMTVERAAEAARAGAAGIAGDRPVRAAGRDSRPIAICKTVAAELRRAFDTCEAVS